MPPIVDIHCHTFNADDLPVRGFVQRVAFHDNELTDDIAALVDRIIQSAAPGYREEKKRLDQMLAPTGPEAAPVVLSSEQLETEVEIVMAELEQSSPELLRRVGHGMAGMPAPTPSGPVEEGPEGVFDWWSSAKRAVRWAKLFGKQRLDITVALLSNFDERIDLFTPLLVDLGMGLDDTAKTTMHEQLELQEKISRLSMIDRLPGGIGGQVHGFVGFDPRRELRARQTGEIETPLDVVKSAINRYGCIGVKVYPPMGFKPLGNASDPAVPSGDELDDILREFYAWAVEEDVPITAHCNDSNFADESFKSFASPDNWAVALGEFDGLRLNLGHFGGARTDEEPAGWPWKAAAVAAAHPNVFADVGNHKIYDGEVSDAYFDLLEEMFNKPETAVMADRLMFGSDWYMLANHPEHDEFLDQYETQFRDRFGGARTDAFLGHNALTFLGLNRVDNKNNGRLRSRYETYADWNVPSWLA